MKKDNLKNSVYSISIVFMATLLSFSAFASRDIEESNVFQQRINKLQDEQEKYSDRKLEIRLMSRRKQINMSDKDLVKKIDAEWKAIELSQKKNAKEINKLTNPSKIYRGCGYLQRIGQETANINDLEKIVDMFHARGCNIKLESKEFCKCISEKKLDKDTKKRLEKEREENYEDILVLINQRLMHEAYSIIDNELLVDMFKSDDDFSNACSNESFQKSLNYKNVPGCNIDEKTYLKNLHQYFNLRINNGALEINGFNEKTFINRKEKNFCSYTKKDYFYKSASYELESFSNLLRDSVKAGTIIPKMHEFFRKGTSFKVLNNIFSPPDERIFSIMSKINRKSTERNEKTNHPQDKHKRIKDYFESNAALIQKLINLTEEGKGNEFIINELLSYRKDNKNIATRIEKKCSDFIKDVADLSCRKPFKYNHNYLNHKKWGEENYPNFNAFYHNICNGSQEPKNSINLEKFKLLTFYPSQIEEKKSNKIISENEKSSALDICKNILSKKKKSLDRESSTDEVINDQTKGNETRVNNTKNKLKDMGSEKAAQSIKSERRAEMAKAEDNSKTMATVGNTTNDNKEDTGKLTNKSKLKNYIPNENQKLLSRLQEQKSYYEEKLKQLLDISKEAVNMSKQATAMNNNQQTSSYSNKKNYSIDYQPKQGKKQDIHNNVPTSQKINPVSSFHSNATQYQAPRKVISPNEAKIDYKPIESRANKKYRSKGFSKAPKKSYKKRSRSFKKLPKTNSYGPINEVSDTNLEQLISSANKKRNTVNSKNISAVEKNDPSSQDKQNGSSSLGSKNVSSNKRLAVVAASAISSSLDDHDFIEGLKSALSNEKNIDKDKIVVWAKNEDGEIISFDLKLIKSKDGKDIVDYEYDADIGDYDPIKILSGIAEHQYLIERLRENKLNKLKSGFNLVDYSQYSEVDKKDFFKAVSSKISKESQTLFYMPVNDKRLIKYYIHNPNENFTKDIIEASLASN